MNATPTEWANSGVLQQYQKILLDVPSATPQTISNIADEISTLNTCAPK
jgi:hypothetical protein